ncbi:MAG: polysaccharide biosynthesis C-terminal domain-containing protein [Bacteroidota bacterium]
MISKKFLKSSFIYSVVGALPYVSSIVLIPLFTHKISPQDIGVNAIYLSILFFIQIFSSFCLESYVMVHLFEFKNNPEKLKESFGTVVFSLTALGIFILLITAIFGDCIFGLLFNNSISFFPWGFLTVLTAIFNGFYKVYCNILISQQRSVKFFIINILNFSFVITLSILLVYIFPNSLAGPVLGRTLGFGINFILILFSLRKEFGFKFKREVITDIVKYCYPLLLYSVFSWVISYIDRFVIKHYLVDPSYVGIFDIAVRCTLAIELFQTGVSNAIYPKVFNLLKDSLVAESSPEVNRYYNVFTAIILFIIPLFNIFVPLLIPLVIDKKIYYEAFNFINILSLGFATRILFSYFFSPILFYKKTKILPKIFFYTAIFQIIISIILIKNFQLIGAAWASFAIKPIQVLFLYFESRKIFKFKFNKIKLLYLPMFFIVMVVASELLFFRQYLLFKSIIIFFITSILIFFIYRKELLLFYNQLVKAIKRRTDIVIEN